MSIGLFIFILCILIILFSWIKNKEKKSSVLIQKEEESIKEDYVIRDEVKLPDNSNNFENANNVEKDKKIIIDDEVKEFYEQKENKNLTNKTLAMDKEEVIFSEESELSEHLSYNILVNGIILSEIIAPPRAVKPYKFKRKNRFV